MRIALTGEGGDPGRIAAPRILKTGGHPVILDVRDPNNNAEFINVSILDRDLLRSTPKNRDAVVHAAAWQGIHEFRKEHDVASGDSRLAESECRRPERAA